jgi:plasmid replication initiation protein
MSETHNIQPYKNPELVVLRNPVARAKFGLSLVQTKFLFEVLAFFKDHPEKRFARFYMRDYLHKLGVSSNNFREYVRQVEDMRRRDINIPRSDNMQGINFIGVSLFSSAEYRLDENGDGYIEIEVSDKLKPYFLEIAKGDFFYYHILNTRVLRSTYSIKLYLLLKSYRRFGKLEIPLEELRGILEINDDEYLQYKNFKARVLETARLEMEEKNDICFRYEDTRRSRKSPVEKIIFFIYDNPNAKEILEKARRMFEQDKTIEPIAPKNAPAQSLDLFSSNENIATEYTSAEPTFYTPDTEKKLAKTKKTKLKPKNMEERHLDSFGTEGVQNSDNFG